MKPRNKKICQVFLLACAIPCLSFAQQWGGNNNTTDLLYRSGSTFFCNFSPTGSPPYRLFSTTDASSTTIAIQGEGAGYTTGVLGTTATGKALHGLATSSGFSGYFEGQSYFSEKVGIGTHGPIADLHVNSPYMMVGPDFSAANTDFIRHITLGENFDGPCDAWDDLVDDWGYYSNGSNMYGLEIHRSEETFLQVGIRSWIIEPGFDYIPTIYWGYADNDNTRETRLEFLFDNNHSNECGDLLGYFDGHGASSGGHTFVVNGDALASGSWISSDARFKHTIKPVFKSLDIIRSLEGVTYDYRSSEFPEKHFKEGRMYGFIAQDVKQVLPELVREDADGYLAINYDGIIPILVQGIKEQEERIAQLEEQLEQLQSGVTEAPSMDKNEPIETLSGDGASVLYQNNPNPFSERTVIRYSLDEHTENASIMVFDMQGHSVETYTLSGTGEGSLEIHAGTLKPGMYIYSLIVNGKEVGVKRMILTN